MLRVFGRVVMGVFIEESSLKVARSARVPPRQPLP